MNAMGFLLALNEADEDYVQRAGMAGGHFAAAGRKRHRGLMRALLTAAVVLALSVTVFAVGELIGIWNDRWLQTPAPEPEAVVREAISRQTEKEYTVSVTVEAITMDEAETQKVFAWTSDSMLAMQNGFGSRPAALEGKQRDEVKAVYARYTVVYDHTKTFYRDGTLWQYFYLVRNADGNWEIFDSSDAQLLGPTSDTDADAEPDDQQTLASTQAAPTPERVRDVSGAIAAVTAMIQRWEDFDNVSRVTVDAADYDPAQTEAALQRLCGTVLADKNGWTETYLNDHMAAITVTYTLWQGGSRETETATYWMLQDPETGVWQNSEITGIMDAAGEDASMREASPPRRP